MIEATFLNLDNQAQRRQIFGWSMYDWANSAFSSIVVTTLLGPYLTSLSEKNGGVLVGAFTLEPAAFFPMCVSVSVVLQVVLLPLVGAMADSLHLKKKLLVLFALVGSLATVLLYLVRSDLDAKELNNIILMGGLLFVIANLAFGASVVLCNAFLPDIASPQERDKVSSLGWALGYLGGGVALAISLGIFHYIDDHELAVRFGLALAGSWWLVFTLLFPARFLPDSGSLRGIFQDGPCLIQGMRQILWTLKSMCHNYPETLKFLVAYLVYNDGIQTVITVATLFASMELGANSHQLVMLILMIQFVAFFGSLLFGWLAGRIGAKRSIAMSLVVWAAITVHAFWLLKNIGELFMLGVAVAVVLGGSQALSRSLFSQLIPRKNESEFFAFYEISERGTSWIGPLIFAMAVQLTGNTRIAILSLLVFFIIGLLLLGKVNVRRGMKDAGNSVNGVVI